MNKIKVNLEKRLKFKVKELSNNKLHNVIAIHYDINFNHSVLELQSCERDEHGNFDRNDISIGAIERGEYEIIEEEATENPIEQIGKEQCKRVQDKVNEELKQ